MARELLELCSHGGNGCPRQYQGLHSVDEQIVVHVIFGKRQHS